MKDKTYYFKTNIDKDKYNKYIDLINEYINSRSYKDKYNKYVVDFINKYYLIYEKDDEMFKRLRNYIAHKSHYDDATSNFVKNFKYYLTINNKSVADVSNDLHIAYSTINDWYNGKKYPRVDSIHILADYFNISLKDLTEEHNTKEDKKGVSVPVLGNIPARYTYRGY